MNGFTAITIPPSNGFRAGDVLGGEPPFLEATAARDGSPRLDARRRSSLALLSHLAEAGYDVVSSEKHLRKSMRATTERGFRGTALQDAVGGEDVESDVAGAG